MLGPLNDHFNLTTQDENMGQTFIKGKFLLLPRQRRVGKIT